MDNDVSPYRRFKKADKKAKKAMKKRDNLDKYEKNTIFYDERRKELNRTIASAIEEKEFAKEQIKHPAPAPKYLNNSKNINISPEVNVNSKNKKEIKLNAQFGGKTYNNKKGNNTQQNNKKSKIKTWFMIIAIILALIAVIGLTVRITNCVNDKKENSSTVITKID